MQGFYQVFKALTSYVKQHYSAGLSWNKDGIDAKEALQQLQSGPSGGVQRSLSGQKSGGGPAPPPPPPMPKFDSNGPPPPPPPPKGTPKAGDMDAVFSQLNQGEAVTAGLRKVDKTEMTHKNPSLRASSTVPTSSDSQTSLSSSSRGVPPGKKPKPEGMRTKRPPRKELDGNKWIVVSFALPSTTRSGTERFPQENLDGEPGASTIDAQIHHSVLISRCRNSTIRLTGKANAVSIDNCTRVSLILDSLVSAVDVIKSPNVAIQVLGSLPTILLDQVDGATIYLGRDSLGCELFTSKCSSVNINVPGHEGDEEDEEGDFNECAVPEQIKSVIRQGRVVSEIVEHAG